MKFNFEKAKDIIKKTTIGVGVVAGSFSSLESKAQETKKDTIQNNTEVSMDQEFYRNEYIKYMEHPSYKERLAKEMYGDKVITNDDQQIIDNEFNKRLNQIKTVHIYMLPNIYEKTNDPSYYSLIDNEVNTTPYAAPHELSHAVDYSDEFASREIGLANTLDKFLKDRAIEYFRFIKSSETEEYRNKMLLFSSIVKQYILENKNNVKFTIPDGYLQENESSYDFMMNQLDELNLRNFDLKKYNEYISSSDREIINKHKQIIELTVDINKYLDKLSKLQNNHFYYLKNTEIKARLNYLRIRAINEYKYDQGSEFQINKFDELKNDKQYQELKENLGFTDEQINELMKYTAMNEDDDKNEGGTYYHPGCNYGDKDNNQT